MHGCGNDFILVDNREMTVSHAEQPGLAEKLCRRKFDIGADGLVFIEKPDGDEADFKWKFYNADGSEAEMCGNGGRCAALFAWLNKITGRELAFETLAGVIHASITGENQVKLQLTPPTDLATGLKAEIDGRELVLDCINTGVPHACCLVDDIDAVDVEQTGRAIRFHKLFAPNGTNVNFVTVHDSQTISIRTYERGVEAETMACGTGAVASAIVSAISGRTESPVDVRVAGGDVLKIHFSIKGQEIVDVFMEGPAVPVCIGETL